MTTKTEIIKQIQNKLSRNHIFLTMADDKRALTGCLDLGSFDKNVYLEEIPCANLLSYNKFWIIISRNRHKTLILETSTILNDKQIKKITDFMCGIKIEETKPAHRYDKNRCFVVNYDGNYPINY